MTLPLPYPVPAAAAGWTLADYKPRVVITSPPAAAGRAAATGDLLPLDELWLIDHMVTSCTSSAATSLRLYDTQEGVGFLLDGTDKGNFSVADCGVGLQLAPGGQLLAVWSGAAAGSVGTLVLQARVMRRSS